MTKLSQWENDFNNSPLNLITERYKKNNLSNIPEFDVTKASKSNTQS